jgi:hypothetical protein
MEKGKMLEPAKPKAAAAAVVEQSPTNEDPDETVRYLSLSLFVCHRTYRRLTFFSAQMRKLRAALAEKTEECDIAKEVVERSKLHAQHVRQKVDKVQKQARRSLRFYVLAR